ncbi:MAG: flavin reductase family protein [Actinomycetota bacterium]|nr:flavin reductase family protein [Actinomycetota bacterium]
MFATGVTVVTTRNLDVCYGMTANAFSSVSLEPPLVLVCVNRDGDGRRQIGRNGRFAVNILSDDQEQLSRYFASPERPRGREAFRDVPHYLSESGSPILEGVAGYLDCRLAASHAAGDHMIFVGEVTELEFAPDASPLVFYRGDYRRIA